jgi:serine/threonine-protein kinase
LTPFFSPDGEWVGFFAGAALKKISLGGGTPITVASAPPTGLGASWGDDDHIVYAPMAQGPLYRVPASGGAFEVLVEPDPAQDEIGMRWPEVLPGSDTVLYTLDLADTPSIDDTYIVARSLASGATKRLVQGSVAQYVPTGHLLYLRAGSLLAVPFDLERLDVSGSPVTVVEEVVTNPMASTRRRASRRAIFSWSGDLDPARHNRSSRSVATTSTRACRPTADGLPSSPARASGPTSGSSRFRAGSARA